MDLKKSKKELETNGWVLVKKVFSKEEVADFRDKILKSQKEGFDKGDLLSNPYLGHYIYDDRILEIASTLLGGKPVYFGDSSYNIASVAGRISHGFHKDNADRMDSNAPDWQTPYTIIRIGFYLQDHSNHSEGLLVRNKSHKIVSAKEGKAVIVPNEPGDIVVWYQTTSHSGGAKILKFPKSLVLEGNTSNWLFRKLYWRLPQFLMRKAEADRFAMFTTFGLNDHHLSRHIQYLKKRHYAMTIWQNSKYKPELLEKIASKPLDVLNMYEEVKGVKIVQESTGYFTLPY